MKAYLYRRGNGNEGNFIRAVVELQDGENPYAALRALLVNDYIAGKRVRKHIIRNVEIDGESDFGIHATVYEGPEGETDFGAAYITAELQPLSDKDDAYYRDSSLYRTSLRKGLDRGALKLYREHAKE